MIDRSDWNAIFFLIFGVFTNISIASTIINKIGVGKATATGLFSSFPACFCPKFLRPSYFTYEVFFCLELRMGLSILDPW